MHEIGRAFVELGDHVAEIQTHLEREAALLAGSARDMPVSKRDLSESHARVAGDISRLHLFLLSLGRRFEWLRSSSRSRPLPRVFATEAPGARSGRTLAGTPSAPPPGHRFAAPSG